MLSLASAPPLWLRDNCPCSGCRNPRNGQKLFQITELPAALAVGSVQDTTTADGDPAREVVWAPDGHRSVYPDAWLDAHLPGTALAPGDGRTEDDKDLWDVAGLTGRGFPEADWAAYTTDDAVRAAALDSVLRLGFVLLHDVPVEPGRSSRWPGPSATCATTNYGALFDVRAEPQPVNLAYTGARSHRTPTTRTATRCPTLQLLHCLTNAAQGGDSGLVDGFHAASLLRAEDPEAYRILTRVPVPFAFADDRTELRAHRPLIGTDPAGRIREIRFNNRSIGTLHQPADVLDAFYAAYRRFGELLLRSELQLDFRLTPGDCLVFDNTRLLHARTAFAESGDRHLQGAYADIDGLASTLAVLRRKESTA